MNFLLLLVVVLSCFGAESSLLEKSKEAREAVLCLEAGSADLPDALLKLQISQDKLWQCALKKASDQIMDSFKASGELMVNVLHEQSQSLLDSMHAYESKDLRDLACLEQQRRTHTSGIRRNAVMKAMARIRFFNTGVALPLRKTWAQIKDFSFLQMVNQMKFAIEGRRDSLYLSELKFLVEVKALSENEEKAWREFHWLDKLYKIEDLVEIAKKSSDDWRTRSTKVKKADFIVDDNAREEYVCCKSMLIACAHLENNSSLRKNHEAHLSDVERRMSFWQNATLRNISNALKEIDELRAGSGYFLNDVLWRAKQICSSRWLKENVRPTLEKLTPLKCSRESFWDSNRACERFSQRQTKLWSVYEKDELNKAVRASIEGQPESFEFFELCIRVGHWGAGAKNKLLGYAQKYAQEFNLVGKQGSEKMQDFVNAVFDDMCKLERKIQSVRGKSSAILYIQKLRHQPWDIEDADSTHRFLRARLMGLLSQGLLEKDFIEIFDNNFFKSDHQIFAEQVEVLLSGKNKNKKVLEMFLQKHEQSELQSLEKDLGRIRGGMARILNCIFDFPSAYAELQGKVILSPEEIMKLETLLEPHSDVLEDLKKVKKLHIRPWLHQKMSVADSKFYSETIYVCSEPFVMMCDSVTNISKFLIASSLENHMLKIQYGVRTLERNWRVPGLQKKAAPNSYIIGPAGDWVLNLCKPHARWLEACMLSDDFFRLRAKLFSKIITMPKESLLVEIEKEKEFLEKCSKAKSLNKEKFLHSVASLIVAADCLCGKQDH